MVWIQQQEYLQMIPLTLTKLLKLGMPVGTAAFRTGATVAPVLQPDCD